MTTGKIMIVEDEKVVAMDIRQTLRRLGHQVSACVASASEALEQVAQVKPDLILMDVVLKGGRDGIETARLIKQLCDVPIIYLTAHADQETLERAKRTEPFGYLIKPFDQNELQTAIEIALFKHRSERAQKASEARLAEILNAAYDAIVTIDESHAITQFNPGAERVFGISTSQAAGRPFQALLREDHRLAARSGIERFRQSDEYSSELGNGGEIACLHSDGRDFPASASISKLRMGDQVEMTIVLRDLTERKQLEMRLRRAQKMEALGSLTGGIAHDFNNLLSAILGYSSLALHRLERGLPCRNHILEIQNAGERAAAMTRQLLSFSRQEMTKPAALDLNQIISGLRRMLQRVIAENIRLGFELCPELGRVKADRSQVEQILINLVVNARDAMPEGGNLVVRTSRADAASALNDGAALNGGAGPMALLTVSDDGIGMDSELVSRIFDPFFTTKPEGRGTGLGLATVYAIVQQSGGHISVSSRQGEGTSFRVYLPLAGKEVRRETSHSLPKPESLRGQETILVVEDEHFVRQVIREVLCLGGYKVLAAPAPQSAMEVAASHPERIHLLVSDVVLPDMSGPELAIQLKDLRRDMKVLLMSGYARPALAGQTGHSSDFQFIEKPLRPAGFLAKVRQVLDSTRAGPSWDDVRG